MYYNRKFVTPRMSDVSDFQKNNLKKITKKQKCLLFEFRETEICSHTVLPIMDSL